MKLSCDLAGQETAPATAPKNPRAVLCIDRSAPTLEPKRDLPAFGVVKYSLHAGYPLLCYTNFYSVLLRQSRELFVTSTSSREKQPAGARAKSPKLRAGDSAPKRDLRGGEATTTLGLMVMPELVSAPMRCRIWADGNAEEKPAGRVHSSF